MPFANLNRRDLLRSMAGLGAFAAAGRYFPAIQPAWAGDPPRHPLAPQAPHFAPRAKRVIHLFMNGGPSHVDTFDPKPMLDKYDGRDPHQVFKVEPTQFNSIGKMLKDRIHLVLGEPKSHKKWITDFYNLRSRIIHGDYPLVRSGVKPKITRPVSKLGILMQRSEIGSCIVPRKPLGSAHPGRHAVVRRCTPLAIY
jgi:hypothetical protein